MSAARQRLLQSVKRQERKCTCGLLGLLSEEIDYDLDYSARLATSPPVRAGFYAKLQDMALSPSVMMGIKYFATNIRAARNMEDILGCRHD